MPKELLYPCFLACTDYTDDNFWMNVFEELAFGVCPSSTYINKNYIISNTRGKEFVYKINPDLDPETLFWDVYNLLSEKVFPSSLHGKLKNTSKISTTLKPSTLHDPTSRRKLYAMPSFYNMFLNKRTSMNCHAPNRANSLT